MYRSGSRIAGRGSCKPQPTASNSAWHIKSAISKRLSNWRCPKASGRRRYRRFLQHATIGKPGTTGKPPACTRLRRKRRPRTPTRPLAGRRTAERQGAHVAPALPETSRTPVCVFGAPRRGRDKYLRRARASSGGHPSQSDQRFPFTMGGGRVCRAAVGHGYCTLAQPKPVSGHPRAFGATRFATTSPLSNYQSSRVRCAYLVPVPVLNSTTVSSGVILARGQQRTLGGEARSAFRRSEDPAGSRRASRRR